MGPEQLFDDASDVFPNPARTGFVGGAHEDAEAIPERAIKLWRDAAD
jgi:hypothetical protein